MRSTSRSLIVKIVLATPILFIFGPVNSQSPVTQQAVMDILDSLVQESLDARIPYRAQRFRAEKDKLVQRRLTGSLLESDIKKAEMLLDDYFDLSAEYYEWKSKRDIALENIFENSSQIPNEPNPNFAYLLSNRRSALEGFEYQAAAAVEQPIQELYDIANFQSNPIAAGGFDLDSFLLDKGVGGDVCNLVGRDLGQQSVQVNDLKIPGAPKELVGDVYLGYTARIEPERKEPLVSQTVVWKAPFQLDKSEIVRQVRNNLPDDDCSEYSAKNEVMFSSITDGIKIEVPVVMEVWFCAKLKTPCVKDWQMDTCTNTAKTKGPTITKNARGYIKAQAFSDRIQFDVSFSGTNESYSSDIEPYTELVEEALPSDAYQSFTFSDARLVESEGGGSDIVVFWNSNPMRLGKACELDSRVE